MYDVAHEKNRKKQLDLYLRRTRKEIEEQEKLRANEKKSERKKGEREKREAEQVWNKAPKGFLSSQPQPKENWHSETAWVGSELTFCLESLCWEGFWSSFEEIGFEWPSAWEKEETKFVGL